MSGGFVGRGPEEEMGSGDNRPVLLLHTGLGTSIWTLRKRPSTWKLKEMFYDRHGETLGSSALSRSSGDRGGGVGIWPVLCRDITHMDWYTGRIAETQQLLTDCAGHLRSCVSKSGKNQGNVTHIWNLVYIHGTVRLVNSSVLYIKT